MTLEYYSKKKLLANGSTNAKTVKNDIRTFIMYMSPSNANDKGIDVCGHASQGCIDACLNSAGMGVFSNVQQGRRDKTNYYAYHRNEFLNHLAREINSKHKTAVRRDEKIAYRLNGTSDLDFVSLLNKKVDLDVSKLENALFYDYTPNLHRALRYKDADYYTVAFSRKEDNEDEVDIAIANKVNVAIVFDELPKTYKGVPVVDGDTSDLVMTKHSGVILGLIAKGKAKKDDSGFVVKVNESKFCEI